jgi:hypothetical protein
MSGSIPYTQLIRTAHHQVIGIVPADIHFQSNVRGFLIFQNYSIKNARKIKSWHIDHCTRNVCQHIHCISSFSHTIKHVISAMTLTFRAKLSNLSTNHFRQTDVCTYIYSNRSAVNQVLTDWQFCCVLETVNSLQLTAVSHNYAPRYGGPVRAGTCCSWHTVTLLWH